jgi:hypothetical protein
LSQTIEVIVSPKGETRVETKGFTGTACRQASQSLEEALGLRESEKLTAEFHQQEAAQNQVRQGGGS